MPSLPAFRITSIGEQSSIPLPAEVEAMVTDFFRPNMLQIRYRGEWYLVSREALNAAPLLHRRA